MRKKEKLFIYSACYLYGGSERLMKSIYSNEYIEKDYDITFGYYNFKEYEEGLKRDNGGVLDKNKFLPLMILDYINLYDIIDKIIKNKNIGYILKMPFFLAKKTGIYSLWNVILFYFLLKKLKPQVVHVNNGGYPAATTCNDLVLTLKLFPKIRVIYQVNNIARQTNSYLDKKFDKLIFKRVYRFITHSENAAKALIRRGVPIHKVLTMPSFFEEKLDSNLSIRKEFGISDESVLLVSVGFLEHRKGQFYLLKAINLLKENHKDIYSKIKLILVGNGVDKDKLENYIKTNDLVETVILAGYRIDSKLFINDSDLYILPSIADEDLPLVLLTAIQYNKSIIASKFAGISDILTDGFDALLVEPDIHTIASELTKCIIQIINNTNLADDLKRNLKLTNKKKLGKGKYSDKLMTLYSKANLHVH